MEQISSSVAVHENYLSPGSDQELLFVDHNDKTSHKNSADVSVSEEEAANTVGTLTTTTAIALAALQQRGRAK